MKVISSLTLSIISIPASAFDFSNANGLFARRAENDLLIDSARAEYSQALSHVSGHDYIFAVEQMARLMSYKGLKLIDSNAPQRVQIFQQCMDDVELINPSLVGATPQYYYWKGVCLAQWGRANGVIQSLVRSQELIDTLDAGVAIDSTYEGGGYYRIKGAFLAKLPSLNPFGPTRDLEESKRLLELSIASPAYSQSSSPESDTGDYYFSTYYYYAETLEAMGLNDQARTIVNESMARIDSGDIPPSREPEERLAYKYLQLEKDRIGQ